MFRGILSLAFASITSALALPPEPPAEVYHNRTTVQNPQVNARHVVNDGVLISVGNRAWDSQNTLTFTNRGTMAAAPGFLLETVSVPFGFRTPAESFFNSSSGEIMAADSGFGFATLEFDDGTIFRNLFGFDTSIIKVNANNVTNRGLLNVGANGFIQVHGRNVDLTAGALVVGDIDDPLSGGGFGGGFPSLTETNFFPSTGIFDLAWGMGSFTNARVGGVITSVNPGNVSTPTPPPTLTNSFGGTQSGAIQLDEAMLWTREEVIDETNEVVQVIAVQVSDPNIGVLASFVPVNYWDSEPLGGYLTAMVELQVGSTDFTTLERVTNSLYIADQLGSGTNRVLMENQFFGTFRPGNFVVFRDLPNQFFGQPASTNVRDDILVARLNGTNEPIPYVGDIFTNEWAGYEAEVESVAARLPFVPGVAVTNLGGQVEIDAGNLTIRNTRIRGEGFVTLTATNVIIGGSNIVDSPRISLDLGSGPGNLQVNEFVPDFVERFNGTFEAYGTVFTNFYERFSTNTPTDPADTNITIVTQQVEVRFQVTIVDARGLQTREPVTVYDLKLTATNNGASIVYNENLTVNNSLRIDARELTFGEGSSVILPAGGGFSYTNLLNVRTFTNLGFISVSELVDLRSAEFTPFERFFNGGSISGNGVDIWADEFGNTGSIESDTLLNIRGRNLTIDSGFFDAGLDIRLTGENATIANLEAVAGARLVLDVSQTLTDRGFESPNFISTLGGVVMTPTRPAGSLLGTTIVNGARPLDFVDFVWSADDRGESADAFENNLALGRVVLEGGRFSVFQFVPAREGAALYVDVLEVSGTHAESLSALTNSLVLGMNIYYSDVVSTNVEITAQALDRLFGPDAQFNLIWVPEFVGPSSVEITLGQNGPVSRMNRSLRQSMVLDSDEDGIPNALDQYPLTPAQPGEGSTVQLVNTSRTSDSITFNVSGSASAKFVIEYSTNLVSPNWQAVTGTITAEELGSFTDRIEQGAAQGYYRVKLVP